MRRCHGIVCGLPLPRYIKETCCQDRKHIDNFQDEDYQDVFREAANMVKACLEVSFPGAMIFESLATFGYDESSDMVELRSLAGLSIWSNTDPVHLTSTAYGDLAEALLKTIASTAEEGGLPKRRRRTESVVTRRVAPAASTPTPGWILGDSVANQRGRGGPGRGFGGSARGRGGRSSRGGGEPAPTAGPPTSGLGII